MNDQDLCMRGFVRHDRHKRCVGAIYPRRKLTDLSMLKKQ
jgi:hypothetical protein